MRTKRELQQKGRRRIEIRRQRERMKLCVRCGRNPMKQGRVHCEPCLITVAASTASFTKRWRQLGRCGYLGCHADPKEGRTLCEAHLQKMLEASVERRAHQKANGLCINSCGRKVEIPSKLLCLVCDDNRRTRLGLSGLPVYVRKMIREGFNESRRRERNDFISSRLYLLSKSEQSVVRLKYRLDRYQPKDRTLTRIGEMLGFTRERARQIHDKSMLRIIGLKREGELPRYVAAIFRKLQKYPDRLDQRNRARLRAQRAIREGHLVRQPCQTCGATEGIEAHHYDYDKPLDVYWLCKRCHVEEHKRERAA